MLDLAVPKNNEGSLLSRAKQLGSELVFLYEFKSLKEIKEKKKEFPEQKIGLLVRATELRELKAALKFYKKVDLVVASSTNTDVIRKITESSRIDLFTNIATSTGRDHMHYRRSNFNQVLAKLCASNNQAYMVNFKRVLNVTNKKRALLLGRIMQNIRFCRKYKIPVLIASFATTPFELRNMRDLQAFARVLGANPLELADFLNQISFRKGANYIAEGIQIINENKRN